MKEVAQLAKCFLQTHEGLSSDTSVHIKAGTEMQSYLYRWEVVKGVHWPASLANE